MSKRPLFASALVVAASLLAFAPAHADFDPGGKKPKRPPVGPKVPGPGPKIPGPKVPGPVGSTSTAAAEEPKKKDPIPKASLIALARPGETGPVLKLAQLYRERDGSLDKGIAEWKAKAADVASGDETRWAASMAYAGLLKSDRRDKDAEAAYELAIKAKPDRPIAILALARLKQDAGDLELAYLNYAKALLMQKDKMEREATLRSLMELAIDRKDYIAAKKWHDDLMKGNGDSMAVRAELARTYMRKARYEQAEAEYQLVAKAAAGDNRTLPAALLDLGIAQIRLLKYDEAVKTLEKGLAVAGAQAGVRPRLLNAIADAYRAQNKIEEFVKRLEAEKPGDVDRQELLGKLAAEFDSDKAIIWLSKALAGAASHVDTRILLIRLLKEQSRIDEAVKQYDLLIQHAKGQPQFVFDLCDLLIGRGEKPKALAKLKALEGSAAGDPDVLQRLAGYYSQVGEDKLALALMERLAGKASEDPSYIVDLGDYYYQRGQTPKARDIWKKLLTIIKPKAKALVALGEVYMDHDLGDDALETYKEAIDLAPSDLPTRKGYAAALERAHRYPEAQSIWEGLLKRTDVDKPTRREARTHLVILWTAQKKLEPQVRPLTEAFKATPPDLESGRLLAEVQLHLRRLPDAEKTLKEIVEVAPGDVDARLVLERVLVQQGQVPAAIKVLEELVKADPKGARAYYTRLAQYALQIYKDEDAIRYAASAVELSPEDADGHKKLGEMYRSQQEFAKAIKEFRLALTHNPKLWPVYFELAELLLAQGEELEADVLYRRVMRGSNDDEFVGNAIRFSTAINQKRGTLEVLETELLPIALSNPAKAVYRRLLVEVYANLTQPLIFQVKSNTEGAAAAKVKLVKIGARGVQPLVDALSDTDVSQQRTAIEILAFVENRSAGAPLFAFATGKADAGLRARAMIAAGALRDPNLLPKFEGFLFPKVGSTPKDAIAVAASFGLARIADKKAAVLQQKIIESSDYLPKEMRLYSVLALGHTKDKKFIPVLETYMRHSSTDGYGRAAAIYALGELGDPSVKGTLLSHLESTDLSVRQAAMLALARLATQGLGKEGKGKRISLSAEDPLVLKLAEAVFDNNERVRRAATMGLSALALGEFRPVADSMPVPDGPISMDTATSALIPTLYGPKDFSAALLAYEKPLANAASMSLSISPERMQVVLDMLLAKPTGSSFGVFTGKGADPLAEAAAARIEKRLETSIAALPALDKAPPVQALSIRWLGRRDSSLARDALVSALSAPSLDVQRQALVELGSRGDASCVEAVAALAKTSPSWSVRADAVKVLGEIGVRDKKAEVLTTLSGLLVGEKRDEIAFVREASVYALHKLKLAEADRVLSTAAREDAEPRVREAAAKKGS